MRWLKVIAVIGLFVLGASLMLSAKQNKFGVADERQITFDQPIHVGNTFLPKGDYQVLHTMEGDNHVMVFKQLNKAIPAEAKVKCTLVNLAVKADQTQKIYVLNTSKEEVLRELVFRGDTAKHVF